MRCFTHQDKEAVGICKGCNKGICAECTVDMDHSIVCTSSHCEEKAQLLDSTVKRNAALIKRSSALFNSSKRLTNIFPVLCIAMGLAFIYHGSEEYPGADPSVTSLLMSIGIGLLIFAGIYYFMARKIFPDFGEKGP